MKREKRQAKRCLNFARQLQPGRKGFTLIEMSIVMVIIGLIVGGVLVGQDLIRAAYIRAQISQIEKFNTAVNTFYGKFQALPGDMNNQTAQAYGFSMAVHNGSGTAGQGDGDGMIVGGTGPGSSTYFGVPVTFGGYYSFGETAVFWVDLSSSVAGNLIEGGFNSTTEATGIVAPYNQLSQYAPPAKLGNGNYVYVTSINGFNYYNINHYLLDDTPPTPALTVTQAYNIDRKIDDGFPTTGRVAALMTWFCCSLNWPAGPSIGTSETYAPVGSLFNGTAAAAGNPASPDTCFEAPTVGSHPTYSTEINGGSGLNCSLVLQFQ